MEMGSGYSAARQAATHLAKKQIEHEDEDEHEKFARFVSSSALRA
jgi:hypothetical protein